MWHWAGVNFLALICGVILTGTMGVTSKSKTAFSGLIIWLNNDKKKNNN